ncbi:methyltransferase [Vibrio viridaestus]|uniref:Ribosomal RNA large subunit methyltransferase G n=1 Tax=Vibrio viridaestus TaxID=2487322 RepID=A0A3N9U708_9VIBR|nr:methyltransferase [Vibrio viridaestus]RQW63906.1 methyltransferase domain-containing protein [Vibrio viridaestus]
MKTLLELGSKSLHIHRYPQRKNETLQAWDAGDEYLINYLEEKQLPANTHIVIINDHFGALSCWFSEHYKVTTMSDSFVAHKAIESNLQINNCKEITLLTTMDPIPSDADIILFQLPKSNRHLTWILSQIQALANEECEVVSVGKVKNIHTSTLNLFSSYLGTTTTSLAWKKHRLIFSKVDKSLEIDENTTITWSVDSENITLTNLPNVFSGESLDIGARFFLEHLPVNSSYEKIIDLGCGNGVLSIQLARLNKKAHILAIDESYMAVASTKMNFETNDISDKQRLHTQANNCLDGIENNSADCIVCNPPFHQQNTITDHIAWQMFCDSQNVLKAGGHLYVIGNRHLDYHAKLIRVFGKSHVKTIAQNKKFVILQASK